MNFISFSISGLDPAGPYYENTPLEVRLDSTDAQFVDVIHTDAEKLVNMGMGINQVSGHVDFWPNDGIAQPGCDQVSTNKLGIPKEPRKFMWIFELQIFRLGFSSGRFSKL